MGRIADLWYRINELDRRIAGRADAPNPPAAISMVDWSKMFRPGATVNYAGNTLQAFQVGGGTSSPGSVYYSSNSVVFACAMVRMLLFSESRFQFQQMRGGRPGDLFGTPDLALLERPWANGTTRDLLVQMELDVTLAGNSYWVVEGGELVRLEPGSVTILTEGVLADASPGFRVAERLIGYAVKTSNTTTAIYEPQYVCHYAPIPDDTFRFRGLSWLSACLPDIEADQQMTTHKTSILSGGAQLSYIVTFDKDTSAEQFDAAVAAYRAAHEGAQNAGKTLFLQGGTDVKTVSQTFEQLSVKATQGAGETRIAACSGVPPVIVGLSEGLSSATYSNYGQARRRLVDGTMRPLWGAAAGALQTLIPPPGGSRLWYDDRDIPFLREDVKDQAEILQMTAATMEICLRSGWTPESVLTAVPASDLSRLEPSGLFSVQLQQLAPPPDQADQSAMPAMPAANGNGAKPAPTPA